MPQREDFIIHSRKDMALKEYKKINGEFVRTQITQSLSKKWQVMVFAFEIEYKYLEYVEGDKLDPYTMEYTGEESTTYRILSKNMKAHCQILHAETWHFFIKNTRLKYKRTKALR